jgi:hypothetical protein
MEQRNKIKTRDLSYYKYFEQLQLEYIQAEVRKKIYPSLSDKSFYKRVMEGKKEKIEDLAIRNNLKSIFNNENVKVEKYKLFFNESGLPNFFYRSDQDKTINSDKDKRYYYMVGSEVRVKDLENKEKIGKIDSVSFSTQTASIEFEEGKEFINIFDLDKITRIL